jgi:mannose-6-phosphate isomerase-like protein (cupin superfamily)
MTGYLSDIETLTLENSDYRRVLYTGSHLQLVLMTLKVGQEIGSETHATHDQFFRIEEGHGEIAINGTTRKIKDGDAIIVPAGACHNLMNTGKMPLRLYTLYSPPNHRDQLVEKRKAEANASDEVFDGITMDAPPQPVTSPSPTTI